MALEHWINGCLAPNPSLHHYNTLRSNKYVLCMTAVAIDVSSFNIEQIHHRWSYHNHHWSNSLFDFSWSIVSEPPNFETLTLRAHNSWNTKLERRTWTPLSLCPCSLICRALPRSTLEPSQLPPKSCYCHPSLSQPACLASLRPCESGLHFHTMPYHTIHHTM